MSAESGTATGSRSAAFPAVGGALLILGAFVAIIVQSAWLSDDAYITFRSLHLLAADFGPNFNVGERVQVYTHPLWYAILAAGFALTKELYLTTLYLSIALSVLVAIVFLLQREVDVRFRIFGLGLLGLSAAFVDYSTSGLENPLGHLVLVGAVAGSSWNSRRTEYKQSLLLAAAAGLAFLARPDLILFFVPMLGWIAWRARSRWKRLGFVLLGLSPVAVWELFSLIYYGFPFPNPAYAKLTTGLPRYELLLQGLRYLLASLVHDPLTPLMIGIGVALVWRYGTRTMSLWALGVSLYLAYVVWIGGDFMRGRFLSAALLVATMLLVRALGSAPVRWRTAVLIGLTALGLVFAAPRLLAGGDYGRAYGQQHMGSWGIADERAAYYPYTGLMRSNQVLEAAAHPGALEGSRAASEEDGVTVWGTLGFYSFYAGRNVHVIDRTGLADPLLARLQPIPEEQWRIGHLDRRIPVGYLETLETGEVRLEDQDLAAYYEKLSVVTRGALFSRDRLTEIVKLNLGMYDYYLQRYESRVFDSLQPSWIDPPVASQVSR